MLTARLMCKQYVSVLSLCLMCARYANGVSGMC